MSDCDPSDSAIRFRCPACRSALPDQTVTRDQLVTCEECGARLLVLVGEVVLCAGEEDWDLVLTVTSDGIPGDVRYRTRRILNRLRWLQGPYYDSHCACGSDRVRYTCEYCGGCACGACGKYGVCPWCLGWTPQAHRRSLQPLKS